jgi:hypothetical protein
MQSTHNLLSALFFTPMAISKISVVPDVEVRFFALQIDARALIRHTRTRLTYKTLISSTHHFKAGISRRIFRGEKSK